jgi:hypothetical protein
MEKGTQLTAKDENANRPDENARCLRQPAFRWVLWNEES